MEIRRGLGRSSGRRDVSAGEVTPRTSGADQRSGAMLRDMTQYINEVMGRTRELEIFEKTISARMASLEASIEQTSGNFGNRELEQLIGSIRGVQERVDHVEEGMRQKVDLPEFHRASQAQSEVEAAVADMEQTLAAGKERMRQLEHAVQERPAPAADVQGLRSKVHDLQVHFDQLLALWAKQKVGDTHLKDSQQVWDTLTDVQSKVQAFELIMQKNLGGNQMQELRSTIANLQSLTTSRQSFQDTNGKMNVDQAEDFKNDLKRMERQIASMDQDIHNMANKSDTQQLRQTVQEIQMQVGKVAHERVSLPQHQQSDDILAKLEGKITSADDAWATRLAKLHQLEDAQHLVQNALKEKAGAADLEEVRCVVATFQSKLRRLEGQTSVEAFSGTAPQDVEQLQGDSNHAKAQLATMDRAMHAKADTSDLQPVSDAVKVLDAKLLRLESKVQFMGQAPAAASCGVDSGRQHDSTVSMLKTQFKDLEQAIGEKSGAAEHRQLKGAVSTLQAQMASLSQVSQETAGMDTLQQVKTNILSIQAQMHTINQELHEKAGSDQLQKLKGAVTNMQVHVTNMEQSVQEKAGSEQMHQLNTVVAEAKSNLCAMEQHKADASKLQQLQDTFSSLQTKIPSSERVSQLEATVTNLGKLVNRVEQGKADKGANPDGFADVHVQVELQHFKGIIAGMEKKVTDIEQELQDKVSQGQMQQCRKTITGVDTKIIGVEQLINEKAGTVQVQQVQNTLQSCISNVEQLVHEKIGSDALQPLKAGIASAHAQIASLEQALHDKVGTNQMQQLKGNIAMVQTKTCGLEQAIQEKAPACQMQQLKDSLSGVQAKVSGVEQTIREQGRSNMQLGDESFFGGDMPSA